MPVNRPDLPCGRFPRPAGLQHAGWACLALVLALMPAGTQAETISDQLDDRGRVVIVKPWDMLSGSKCGEVSRSVSRTASGSPVSR